MPANSTVTITPAAGDTEAAISFGDIHFTGSNFGKSYTYSVREVVPDGDTAGVTYDTLPHNVTLTVEDDGTGKPTVDASYSDVGGGITLTNTFEASGEAVLTATKVLEGRALADNEFFFKLTGDRIDGFATAHAAADGSIAFDPIAFDQNDIGKDFHYTISEVKGTLGGVTYDENSYDVTVHVALGEGSALAITYDYGENATPPVFRNTYTATPTSANLVAHKALVGGTLAGDDFSFELVEIVDGNRVPVQTAKNGADGMVRFDTIEYDTVGSHEYRIREVLPGNPPENAGDTYTGPDGIVYDATEHTVMVNVTDNGIGALEAEVLYDGATNGISFGNVKLVRTGDALLLRALPGGITVIFR